MSWTQFFRRLRRRLASKSNNISSSSSAMLFAQEIALGLHEIHTALDRANWEIIRFAFGVCGPLVSADHKKLFADPRLGTTALDQFLNVRVNYIIVVYLEVCKVSSGVYRKNYAYYFSLIRLKIIVDTNLHTYYTKIWLLHQATDDEKNN